MTGTRGQRTGKGQEEGKSNAETRKARRDRSTSERRRTAEARSRQAMTDRQTMTEAGEQKKKEDRRIMGRQARTTHRASKYEDGTGRQGQGQTHRDKG